MRACVRVSVRYQRGVCEGASENEREQNALRKMDRGKNKKALTNI